MTDIIFAIFGTVVIAMALWLWLCIFAAERAWRDEQDEHATAPAEGWDAVRRFEERRHDL